MEAARAEPRPPAFLKALSPPLLLALLFVEAFLLGQTGVPIEDGGEILTVGSLGGTCHPSGMPVVALFARSACALAGEPGLKALYAAFAALSLWVLFRRSGAAGILLAMAILALPAYRERLLQWDAYGLLFLAGASMISLRQTTSSGLGYLAGLSSGIHPQGLFLALGGRARDRSPLKFASALILGASVYLALPLLSAAGAAVNWGAPGTLRLFMRQVSASGYLEYYGSRMGLSGLGSILEHLRMLGSSVWPSLLLPAAIGAVDMARWNRPLLLRLGILLLADALFVILVNPMAAGTSQTGWMSLLVFAVLCAAAAEALPRRLALLLALAVGLSAFPSSEEPILPDQTTEVEALLTSSPSQSVLFISDNDLLYGGWVLKYCRDQRPDAALLSTGNFSGWFEAMACRYNPDVDLSGSINDVGGAAVGRDSAARALIELAARDNPGRKFYVEESGVWSLVPQR
jgi:hypothetical protein